MDMILINIINKTYRFHQILIYFIDKFKSFMSKDYRIVRDDIC